MSAQESIKKEDQAIEHMSFCLEEYRRECGMPARSENIVPALVDEYSHLRPVEVIHYWADRHNGDVIIKELTRTLRDAGVFTDPRAASATIHTAASRDAAFRKIKPGHFRKDIAHVEYPSPDGNQE